MRFPRPVLAGVLTVGLALGLAGGRDVVAAAQPGGSAAPAARAGPPVELGTLEQQAVDDALAERGLHIDPSPAGKQVRIIHVVNHKVFSRRDSLLQLVNVFHRTTREHVIRREVLLQPGMLWDPALADETVRNLRDADFSSLVVVLPVKSTLPGQVDLLVVTRDVWSLRFNTDFEFQEGTLIFFTGSLSENNLLGWRKKAALVYTLSQGSYSLGPTYVDPNVAGTRLTFAGSYQAYYDRATDRKEGGAWAGRVDYPLFSLASRWGASLSGWRTDRVVRLYDRDGLIPVELNNVPTLRAPTAELNPERDPASVRLGPPATRDLLLPYMYRDRRHGVETTVVRSLGKRVIHRFSLGYSLSYVRPDFVVGFPQDPFVRAAFRRRVFPRDERVSAVFGAWSLFTPRYRVYRDFVTYDLREDVQLGPNAFATVVQAPQWLGTDFEFTRVGANFGWSFDLLDGFQRFLFGWGGRFRFGRFVDETRSAAVSLASPLWRAGRVVSEAEVSTLHRNTRPDSFYTMGGESGLRGYGLNEFQGQARFIAHIEARSRPLALAALRLGVVAFYDVGHAAPSLTGLRPVQDVGAGVRLLVPQLNFYVLRVDWAFPLQRGATTQPGWPGRLAAGFKQVF